MLELHDSLTGTTTPFEPADGQAFRIYACGPTVYKPLTIGNLRSFLTVDLLRRYLEYRGYGVKLVMNITDVGHMVDDADVGDDKILKTAREENLTPEQVIDRYTEVFFRDIDAIGIKRAWVHPRATAHIPEMIELCGKLLDAKHAYVTSKGDVYYDVSSFKEYGKLSGNTVEGLMAGARIEPNPDKKNPADFALWIHNPNHLMRWEIPKAWTVKYPDWQDGYPGWHLECSAMSMKYLGETLDLHTGGEDNKFPHHECEIAQSEGATGVTFSKRWLHVKHLLVDGEKMSKSKGNAFTLPDIVAKGYSPGALRTLLLSAHYRTQLNFTLEGLEAAEKNRTRYRELFGRLRSVATRTDEEVARITSDVQEAEDAVHAALDADLDVSKALAVLHAFSAMMNTHLDQKIIGIQGAKLALDFLGRMESVFGFAWDAPTETEEIPTEVTGLVTAREDARNSKDWDASDQLRKMIEQAGWTVEDTSGGPKLKRITPRG